MRFATAGSGTCSAGHLHQTVEIPASDGAYTTFVVGGTARILDERGWGYRVFDVGEDGVEQRYVEIDRPSSHWLVRYGWSPRIVDPSLSHWVLTIVFLLAARAAWRARRAMVARPDWDEEDGGPPWRFIALAYGFLAFNLQLDFDEVFAAVGRSTVYGLGLGSDRRILQAGVLAVGGFAFLVTLFVLRRSLGTSGRRGWLAILGLSLPVGSFLLHMLSLHQTEVLMYVLGRYGLYLVEAAGAGLTIWMAVRCRRAYASEADAGA